MKFTPMNFLRLDMSHKEHAALSHKLMYDHAVEIWKKDALMETLGEAILEASEIDPEEELVCWDDRGDEIILTPDEYMDILIKLNNMVAEQKDDVQIHIFDF